jgi:putative flippase GtrA
MKLIIKALKDKFFDPSMLRWAVVGLSTTLIDYVMFISLYSWTRSVFFSNLISASIATSINYFSHHRWTFKSNLNYAKSGIRYLVNLIFWWFISSSIIQSLIILNVDAKIAKLAPLLVIVPVNYFVLNHLVFKKKT